MNVNDHIPQEDLALHALQVLAPEEAAAVGAHLAQCALCTDQLAEFRGDVAMIGLASEIQPVPAKSRERFLNRIAEDKKLRVQNASNKVVPFPRANWIGIAGWAAAAVFAIAAVLLGVRVQLLNTQLQDATSQIASLSTSSAKARQVLDTLTSRSAQRVLLTASATPPQPTGRAVYIAEHGSLVFQASNLKQIAADKAYELWLIPTTGKPINAGVFRPDASGSASLVLPSLPSGLAAKAFAVTLEKAEGSDVPTSAVIMVGATPTGE